MFGCLPRGRTLGYKARQVLCGRTSMLGTRSGHPGPVPFHRKQWSDEEEEREGEREGTRVQVLEGWVGGWMEGWMDAREGGREEFNDSPHKVMGGGTL